MNDTCRAARLSTGVMMLAVLLTAWGCQDTEIQSTWLTDDGISIDGSSLDWDGKLRPVGDNRGLIGVQNDDTHLYVCIVVTPRELQIPILTGGLSLLFETDGGDEHGFRYPALTPPDSDAPPPRGPGTDALWLRIENRAEIEILKTEGELNRYVNPGAALDVAVGEQYGALVYEAKIPLRPEDDSPFWVRTGGAKFRVGIVTEQPKMMRPDRGSGRSGGMGGPGGGGRSGGGSGGRSGGGSGGGHPGGGRSGGSSGERPPMPKAIEVWSSVSLAEKPA